MRQLTLISLIFILTGLSAQAELYCFAKQTRLQLLKQGSRYQVQILNESSMKNSDPIYLMETLGVSRNEARLLASQAKPVEVQISGFENCKTMTSCRFNDIKPGNLATCISGKYEFRAEMVGSRVQMTCAEKVGRGYGESTISERLSEQGCVSYLQKDADKNETSLE